MNKDKDNAILYNENNKSLFDKIKNIFNINSIFEHNKVLENNNKSNIKSIGNEI